MITKTETEDFKFIISYNLVQGRIKATNLFFFFFFLFCLDKVPSKNYLTILTLEISTQKICSKNIILKRLFTCQLFCRFLHLLSGGPMNNSVSTSDEVSVLSIGIISLFSLYPGTGSTPHWNYSPKKMSNLIKIRFLFHVILSIGHNFFFSWFLCYVLRQQII